jgi:hypothetical protein
MGSHANREERNLTEERQAFAARQWAAAQKSMKATGAGCLILAILFTLGLAYIAGRVAGLNPDCISERSTP